MKMDLKNLIKFITIILLQYFIIIVFSFILLESDQANNIIVILLFVFITVSSFFIVYKFCNAYKSYKNDNEIIKHLNSLISCYEIQVHDFMNTLQLILSLTQLKKYDKIGDKVRVANDRLVSLKQLNRIKSSILKNAIIEMYLTSKECNFNISYQITDHSPRFKPSIKTISNSAIHVAKIIMEEMFKANNKNSLLIVRINQTGLFLNFKLDNSCKKANAIIDSMIYRIKTVSVGKLDALKANNAIYIQVSYYNNH